MPKRAREDEEGSPEADSTLCLPEDVLSVIFSHLDVAGRARASRVCRKWRGAALQPPHSTELTLLVLLDEDRQLHAQLGIYIRSAPGRTAARQWTRSSASGRLERGQPPDAGGLVSGLRASLALPEDGAAALRGPLCSGVQRLGLGLALPPGGDVDAAFIASALATIGAALPPKLLALSLAVLGARWELNARSDKWRAVLARLDLDRTAPRLEDLELAADDGADLTRMGWRLDAWRIVLAYLRHDGLRGNELIYALDLVDLDLGHPSLRRLGASLLPRSGVASALRRLPALEVVREIAALRENPWFVPLAEAGIRTERLELFDTSLVETHKRLLGPGSVLHLIRSTLPIGEDWSLPAGLTELWLFDCQLPASELVSLLSRTSARAPRLEKLSITRNTLEKSCGPHEAIKALEQMYGGTQVDLLWPNADEWCTPDVFTSLTRALAASPILHRYVEIGFPRPLVGSISPSGALAIDIAKYLISRAAALREMGDVGRRLLAEQGYTMIMDRLDGLRFDHSALLSVRVHVDI